jgi:hypothetical protein
MSIPDIETQAILALCHHMEGPFHHDCESCVFRAQAAAEHLKHVISEMIKSLGATD